MIEEQQTTLEAAGKNNLSFVTYIANKYRQSVKQLT